MGNPVSLWGKIKHRWSHGGCLGLFSTLARKCRYSTPGKFLFGPTGPWSHWLQHYLPTSQQLEQFRQTAWGVNRPKFSLIMPVYNPKVEWLQQALGSVQKQTYLDWELVCVDDGSPNARVRWLLQTIAATDKRVRTLFLEKNQGVSLATNAGIRAAGGSHLVFMDHDDYLEPHALHRFSQAIEEHDPCLLYADEALTSEDLAHVHGIKSCPAFSHDFYLSHPYFVHPVCARADVVQAAGWLDPSMRVSHDVDMVLRLIEASNNICHIPDILYRWRLHGESASHAASNFEITHSTQGAIERHLGRLSSNARVSPALARHNFFRLDYPVEKTKVAILIPTKNRSDLLGNCLASLRKTVKPDLADIVLIDHESDEPASMRLLKEESRRCQITQFRGLFNFAAMMNQGVRVLQPGKYSHYLFLNNDTVAAHPGWLEHMAGVAQRPWIGAVGATLLYPDRTLQHAGVIIGLAGPADHSHKFFPYGSLGLNGSLQAIRGYSAVTAACMLVPAGAFAAAGGFDESLAVGFNDTDFCLRLSQLGYEIVQTPYANLFHLESQSRLADRSHPADTEKFSQRHQDFIAAGDPFYSPYLDSDCFTHAPAVGARSPDHVNSRVMKTPWAKALEKGQAA